MRILVTGASGFVGHSLLSDLGELLPAAELIPTGRRLDGLDLTDRDKVMQRLITCAPLQAVLHAAGDKDVKRCQTHPELARAANIETTRNALEVARAHCAPLIFISTDWVFDGTHGPHPECKRPDPSTVYGKTKHEAELLVLEYTAGAVVRTSGVYGLNSPLLTWLIDRLKAGQKTDCFTDVWNSPTWSRDLAEACASLIRAPQCGIFHAAGPERLNRHQFFGAVARAFGYSAELLSGNPIGDRKNELLLLEDSSLESAESQRRLDTRPHSVEEALPQIARSWKQ